MSDTARHIYNLRIEMIGNTYCQDVADRIEYLQRELAATERCLASQTIVKAKEIERLQRELSEAKRESYFGCFTGDCPHVRQNECDAAIREHCARIETKAEQLQRELKETQYKSKNFAAALVRALNERDKYRKAFDDEPHGPSCASRQGMANGTSDDHQIIWGDCDCWKAGALK